MTEFTNNNYLTYDQVKSLIRLMLDHHIKAAIAQGGIAIYPADEKQVRLMLELSLSHGVTLIDSSPHRKSLESDLNFKLRQQQIQHLQSSLDQ